jgi:hypothetical protein
VRPPREALPLFFLMSLLALGGFFWLMQSTAEDGRNRVRYEDLALARLRALGEAQARYRASNPRYGWVEDLEAAGLLGDFGIEKDTQAGTGGLLYLTSPRYRLDVLLPHMMTRNGQLMIALRSAGRRNPDLEKDAFVLVARPWGPLEGGYRTFLLDEGGRLYVSEGVSDQRAMEVRPLPDLHPKSPGVTVSGGMRIYPLDDLPER